MSANSFIRVPPDSTGKEVETNTDGTVQRQVITPGNNLSVNSNTQNFNSSGQGEVVESGAPNFDSAQQTSTATASQLVGANALRRSVTIYCIGAPSNTVYLGNSGSVTTSTGLPIGGTGNPAGITLETTAAIFGICTAAQTQVVAITEVYDNA